MGLSGAAGLIMEITAINRQKAIVLLDTGECLPITHFMDADGDDCGSDDAVACVAGDDDLGVWFSIDLTAFEPVEVH